MKDSQKVSGKYGILFLLEFPISSVKAQLPTLNTKSMPECPIREIPIYADAILKYFIFPLWCYGFFLFYIYYFHPMRETHFLKNFFIFKDSTQLSEIHY